MRLESLKKKLGDSLKNKWFRNNVITILVCAILVFSLSISYAILLEHLNIDAEIAIAYTGEIKITDIRVGTNTTCGYDNFNPKHDNESITIGAVLPELECFIEYEVTVENSTESFILLKNIDDSMSNNENIVYELEGVELYSIIEPDENLTFVVRFKYDSNVFELPTETEIGAVLIFEFIEYKLPAEVIYSTTDWTKENVVATIVFNEIGMTVTNNNENIEYVFEENGSFVFEYENEEGVVGVAVATVTWIDKLIPETFSPSILDITLNSITLHGETEDKGGSGINKYLFSNDNGATWIESENTSYEFINLIPNTTYTFRIKAVDKAGNEILSYSIIAHTESEYTSISLPIFIQPNDEGHYFNFNTFPAGITYDEEFWETDTISLYLRKPQSYGNNGNNQFSATLPIMNASSHQWTGGAVELGSWGGDWTKNVTPSLSTTTVSPQTSFNVDLVFKTKINVNTIDTVRITISFMINGEKKNLYIDLYCVPWNYVIPS